MTARPGRVTLGSCDRCGARVTSAQGPSAHVTRTEATAAAQVIGGRRVGYVIEDRPLGFVGTRERLRCQPCLADQVTA